jgi:hypothetical protein
LAERRAGARAGHSEVALATCHQMPDLDEDGPVLIAALERAGVFARPAIWDHPVFEWDDFDLVVIRTTSDYIWHRDEFVTWARGVPRLANPADVLVWNTDKRYLADLVAAGVPVIPTQFFGPAQLLGPAGTGEPVALASPADLPPGQLVVKPAVSSGALDTSLYGPEDREGAADHVRALQLAGRTALVQPYRERVDEEAETGLIYLGHHFSHAIRKEPMLRAEPASVSGHFREIVTSARTPSDVEREVAEAVLDAVPGGRDRLLYARVDLVPGPDGPELIELEVTEPALYLNLADGAADRFASVIVEQISKKAE